MRILVVTSQFPIHGEPTRGRPLQQTVRAMSRLADVHVVSPVAEYPGWARPRSYTFRPPDLAHAVEGCSVEYTRYRVLPLVTRPFNGWSCGRTLDTALRRFRPDVVLGYWLYPDALGAMQAARRAGLPFLAGARGSDLRVRDAVTRRLTRPVVRAAGRLLVVSEDLGRVAVTGYGADPARIRVVANGCDASLFHLADRDRARASLGLAPDRPLVLYVGRLVPGKGLRELFAAASILAGRRPGVEFALVGDGPMRDEVAHLAAACGARVHLPGALPPAAVAQWMAAADLVTLPSHSEGQPNVLIEALACGRPVVASDVGGIPEIVDDACGHLVPPGDVDALAAALADALGRDWDEAALSRRFSRSWDAVAAETLAACDETIGAHGAGATPCAA